MMINVIPFIGWLLSFIGSASLAIPFWIIWVVCGVGEKYFYFVPTVYLTPGFWECVGLFMVIGILKSVLLSGIFSVSNSNTNEK